MRYFPERLIVILLSSATFITLTPDIVYSQVEGEAAETLKDLQEITSPVLKDSVDEIDDLAEAIRTGAEPNAIVRLEALGELENPRALLLLGDFYSKGPLPFDGNKAVDYYVRASNAGEKRSLVRLGDLYREGTVIDGNVEYALNYYQQASDLGNPTAQLRLGGALIRGSLGRTDSDKGLELLENLADSGNAWALHDLGDLYSMGPLPIDGPKAVEYYLRAVETGNNVSLVRLGDLYRDGSLVETNTRYAIEYYERAAAMGNEAGQLRLGSALIRGNLGEAEPNKGLTLLEGLAVKHNRGALHELGDLYSKGPLPIDGAKSVDYYIRAVAVGNTSSLVRLGDIYRDGAILSADPARAIGYYEMAQAAGQRMGLRNLALGHVERRFGSLSQPTKGAKLLQDAVNKGDLSLSTSLANLYFSGNGVPRDPRIGLQVLRQAADAGSPHAASALISVLRNGRGKDLPRDLSQADAAIRNYASLFAQDDFELEKIVLESARSNSQKEYAAVAVAMRESLPALKQKMLYMVHGSNKNAYTWLLQERLAELGVYEGPLNGTMNSSTVRAVNVYCAQNNFHEKCVQGPLHWTTARALASSLYN